MASITTRNGQRCTAVPKLANILLASNSSSTSLSSSSSSSSTSTSTSTSSTSSSTSTSTSTSSTSASSISTTSSSLLTSSSTSISIPTDPQATPVDNPAQPDAATQVSSDTSSSTSSTASTVAIANSPPVIVQPAITQSADQPSSTTDQSTDQIAPSLPASIVNTINPSSLSTDNTGVLTDAGPTPSQSGDQAQNTDGATSAQLGQPGDSTITTGLDGNTASPTAAGTQSTGSSSSLDTETNKGGLSTTQQQVTGNGITTQQTIAIAAGVVGGVIIISSIAFMIWIWRKRKMQGRRSTLLTPLSPDATVRDSEKDPYLIDRSSLGPTPMSEKLWAVVGMRYKRLRGKVNNIVARSNSPSPSVNLDRGNSQFGPPDGAHSRNNSNAGVIGGPPASKGRFVDWWGRLVEDGNSNWRLRRESKADPINNESYAAVPRSTHNNNAPRGSSRPDFLTLLNMDDRQLEQAERGRNGVRGSQRRSISMGNEQHFLGGLDINFDDPFSDVNAIGNNTAKAKPIVVSAANNPFSDANAITAPSAAANGGLTTYVHNVRRSRGHSVNGGGISRQASNAGTRLNSVMNSMYRESNASVSTVGTRRNKFRSDPFDLDRPDLLSANSSFDATVRDARTSRGSKGVPVPLPNTPKPAHVRMESFTSKYSSGVSMSISQWSDPGPDVGPAAGRYTPSPDNGMPRRDSDTRRSGGSLGSVGSQGSVGKAL